MSQPDDVAARLTQELEQKDSDGMYSWSGAGLAVGAAGTARERDGIDIVQAQINRRLFSEHAASDTGSSHRGITRASGSRHATTRDSSFPADEAMLAARQFRRQKDHFSLALEKPPLLSLSSFSCGMCICIYVHIYWFLCTFFRTHRNLLTLAHHPCAHTLPRSALQGQVYFWSLLEWISRHDTL